MLRFASLCLLLVAATAACGDNRASALVDAMVDSTIEPPPDAGVDANPLMPTRLIDTGLCANPSCTQIAAGVRTFQPRPNWQLWTDGAAKQRWIYLPPGKKIDTSDPNHWRFPVGTKLWKSFSVGGTRLETRYYVKLDTGDNHWFFGAYQWNAAQNDAVLVPRGVENAGGTSHDIPSRNQCRECHDRVPGSVLGFSALALDYTPAGTDLALEELISNSLLTRPPGGSGTPRYPLPTGRTPTETLYARDAIGYLHMNCGHCHNPSSPVFSGTPLELRLTTHELGTLLVTPPYRTAVGVTTSTMIDGATVIIAPQEPDSSVVIKRMNHPNPSIRMPALGTEVVDSTAQLLLRNWILGIPQS